MGLTEKKGVVVGVLAIVLSKNKKSKSLMWSLFIVSLVAALTAAVSAIGLFTSMVRAIIHGGRSLLAHCHFPDAADYSSITNECPFDPTRIYSTTLILWVPLIVTCVIQLVFCARCFVVCISLLGLPCCLTGKGPRDRGRSINAVMPIQRGASPRYSKPPSSYNEPAPRYTEAPRTYDKPRRSAAPLQQQHPTPTLRQYLPRQHHSLPPLESQPLRQPHRVRSDREGQVTRAGSQQRAREQHRLLQRGTLDRSSFWI
ncbi:uncharacterized protein LOC115788003 isoform X2 [Archocentrus centrarchus]|uniref:uncharacterized protein LOC115788003 isoform X2 n=1 Tax=Archocentrus centrarchus TaxID=63155 RepID=UPI0011E9B828|nr:uncharacterized protein LOC115788003 isoform X2 [Archocentrus centrarchus]